MIANMNEKGRQTKLLAAVAVFAMVVCALAIVMPSDDVQAADATALPDADENGVITLTENVTLADVWKVTSDTSLDLAGYTLTVPMIEVGNSSDENGVTLTITDSGTTGKIVKSSGGDATCAIRVGIAGAGTIEMTGGTIDATAGNWYGIGIFSDSTATIEDTTINAKLSAISGNGTQTGSVMSLTDVNFTSEMVAAVFFPSTTTLEVTGGTFTGATGFDIRAGNVTITNVTINIDLENPDWTGSSGPSSYGMGIAIFDHSSYGNSITVDVEGCTINNAVYDYYVGALNQSPENTDGDDVYLWGAEAFDSSKLTSKYTFNDTISLSFPGFTFESTASTAGYQFAAVNTTSTSFTVPSGLIISGTVSFDADDSATLEEIKAGSGGITFRQGSVTISGNIVSGSGDASDIASAITGVSGDVVLSNLTITSGTLDISGDVSVSGNVIVAEEAAIDIQSDATLTVQPNSTLSVSGSVDGEGTLENNGTIALTSTNASIPDSIGGTGNVDNSAVASEGTLSGTYDTTTTFTQNQIITATGDITLVSGTVFTFEGTLIIPEGVTVTVQAGAKLIVNSSTGSIVNNGTIIVESDAGQATVNGSSVPAGGLLITGTASLTNNGVIELAFMPEGDETATNFQLDVISGTLTNNGQINVGEDSRMCVDASGVVNNTSDATVNMNGYFVGEISNAGTVAFNGSTSSDSSNIIYMVAPGATVEIQYLSGNLAIRDIGLTNSNITVGDETTGTDATNITREPNLLRLNTTTANYYVSGLTVVSEVVSEKVQNTTNYYNNMMISGSISTGIIDSTLEGFTPASDGVNVVTFTIDGPRMIVSGEFAVANTVGFNNYDALTVSGTLSIGDGADMVGHGNAVVNVTEGTITASSAPITTGQTVNAASYTVRTTSPATTTYYYTTLANALASGATSVTITGPMTIDEALTIPSGVTVTKTDGATTVDSTATNQNILIISEDGSITVADGGRLNSSAAIDVQGSLYAENKRTGLRGSNYIFSEVKSEGDADILYTNLVNALTNAESGDVITLSNDATIRSNVSIYEGVTLRTEGHNVTIANDVTFTIDGTLYFNSNTGSLILASVTNPDLSQPGEVVLNGIIQSDVPLTYTENGAYPAGAYYSITSNGRMVYYIQPLDDAVANIATFDDSTIQVYGDVTVGDISVTGTADESAIIVVNDKLTAGTITLDNAQVQIVTGAIMDATVANSVGSIDMVAAGGAQTNNANLTIESAANTAGETELTVTGIVSDTVGNDLRYAFTVADIVDFGASTVPGMTVDGTANIDARLTVTGTLTINGTVNVETNGTLSATGRTVLLGDLNIAPVSTEGRGTAQVADIYIGLSYSSTDGISTGADATVTGALSVSGTAYVSAGSTVPANFCENSDSTEFYVEDALWLTAYGTSATVDNAPVTDAKFNGWDNPATTAEETISGVDIDLADYARLDANIDYNVYGVAVVTDGGIGSVAIDGILMTQQNDNTFVLTGLRAGTHTLSYTLKSGYEGTATMNIDGQAISGYEFTLSGDYSEVYDLTINLAGTTPSSGSGEVIVNVPGSGDDGMSLTDILLIVLVILILVMAIIVALRLMRS